MTDEFLVVILIACLYTKGEEYISTRLQLTSRAEIG